METKESEIVSSILRGVLAVWVTTELVKLRSQDLLRLGRTQEDRQAVIRQAAQDAEFLVQQFLKP